MQVSFQVSKTVPVAVAYGGLIWYDENFGNFWVTYHKSKYYKGTYDEFILEPGPASLLPINLFGDPI